jgi:hypothetical protein
LAVSPIFTDKTNDPIAVTESYSVDRPESVASGKIYDKIVEASTKYGIHTDTALRIAYCESRLNQYNAEGNVLHGKQNPADAGIFQINEKWHLSQSQKLGFDIHTTDGNIEYAMWLMKKEGNKHWKWSKPCWGEDGKVKNA